MRARSARAALLTLLVGSLAVAALAGTAGVSTSAAQGRLIKVPQDYQSIGAAVAAAHEGDFILVGPGHYHEAVHVTTPHLTIRGVDRNAVVLEGDQKRDNGVFVDGANGVDIGNMTARNYTSNGFWWDRVTGWRGTFLTAVNNASYGIYAFRSTTGEFSYSYASGNGDSGFYIGACFDCKSLITNVHAQNNGLGYSGTNAGGILIQDSEWDNNVAGIVPNTLTSEDDMPQGGKVGNIITNNYVHDNQNATAPSTFQIGPLGAPLGMGIEIAGGWNNQVINNKVRNQKHYGIVLHWLTTPTVGNQVMFNDIQGSGDADMSWDGIGANNCFEGNTDQTNTAVDPIAGTARHATADPPTLEAANGCGTPSLPLGGNPEAGLRVAISAAGIAPDDRHTTGQPEPGPQATMPDPCGGAPAGCSNASSQLKAATVVNVQPNQGSGNTGYAPIQSLVTVSQGLAQTPTTADVSRAMAEAIANLARNQTVVVPAGPTDYGGYAATAMAVAALFLLIGAALGLWRRARSA